MASSMSPVASDDPRQSEVTWIKAKQSVGADACVELAPFGDLIAVRDSKHPEVHLFYTQVEMKAFINGAKAGEFDFLVKEVKIEEGCDLPVEM